MSMSPLSLVCLVTFLLNVARPCSRQLVVAVTLDQVRFSDERASEEATFDPAAVPAYITCLFSNSEYTPQSVRQ